MNVNEIKTMLEERLGELTDRSKEIDDELSETPDDDWSENAVNTENDEVLEAIGGLAQDEIRKIKTALSRIEAGTYGICLTCQEPIAPERLKALPYATKCINCA
ncbi:MAG: TraR/DksA family transcriptional regulator [Proteobacteria bacterium]|nr:TraR/DksA family transcriptional regulator [Pseudomonadota bacterium]